MVIGSRALVGTVALICLAGCGISPAADVPIPAPPASASVGASASPPSNGADQEAEHARALVGAAVELRAKRGSCPSLDALREAYALADAVFVDRGGEPFRIVCSDEATRVLSGDREMVALGWHPRAAVVPSLAADAGATESANDAGRVIAGARARFRRCYARGLATNPSATGAVLGSYDVLADGTVANVHLAPTGDLSKEVVLCIEEVVKRLQFDPGPKRTVTFGQ